MRADPIKYVKDLMNKPVEVKPESKKKRVYRIKKAVKK